MILAVMIRAVMIRAGAGAPHRRPRGRLRASRAKRSATPLAHATITKAVTAKTITNSHMPRHHGTAPLGSRGPGFGPGRL
jgi:hypothetical protein